MAENVEGNEAAPDEGTVVDHAAESSDMLAAAIIEEPEGSAEQCAVLSALSLYRIACALEALGAEATESLLEEASGLLASQEGGGQ